MADLVAQIIQHACCVSDVLRLSQDVIGLYLRVVGQSFIELKGVVLEEQVLRSVGRHLNSGGVRDPESDISMQN